MALTCECERLDTFAVELVVKATLSRNLSVASLQLLEQHAADTGGTDSRELLRDEQRCERYFSDTAQDETSVF